MTASRSWLMITYSAATRARVNARARREQCPVLSRCVREPDDDGSAIRRLLFDPVLRKGESGSFGSRSHSYSYRIT
jgi:hypothetical protein